MNALLLIVALAAPIVYLEGSDFAGGAASLFGAYHHGEGPVNYVYAASTGARSTMSASFRAERSASGLFLYMRARDDDAPRPCKITILLNETILHDGPSGFPDNAWAVRRFAVPDGALKVGDNRLTIRCAEAQGTAGMPPWFMVARAAIAPDGYELRRDLRRDFRVTLDERVSPGLTIPAKAREADGGSARFAFRGMKGWLWKPEQYLAEIPWIARYRMNFLMNCYGSMCDIEHYRWGDPHINRWWEPLPEGKRRAYEKVVAACKKAGITFCFSMNPNICTQRIVRYGSDEDLDLLWQHYAWMQSLGVRWFNISLDDITEGIDASGQARMVNAILRRLRQRDPGAQMIFCPTYYWGDGTGTDQRPYLETLARELDPDVYLFWTGDSVVGRITTAAARTFSRIGGHRLFLWDNYPVNDANPTMHLGPVIGRDPDLHTVIEGYMANPMHSQNEINRIPLYTCADYAYHPDTYDPERSIGEAIAAQTGSREGREALRDLVECYPGMLIWGAASTAVNPVRERFLRIMAMPHGAPVARAYLESLKALARRLDRAFPRSYAAARRTLRADIDALMKMLKSR